MAEGADSSQDQGRRTQAERSERTRKSLLEATIQSLIDVGYTGTTSRRVASIAEVSRGAQTHHFPHRLDLIAEAVEHQINQRIETLQERAKSVKPGLEGTSQLLDLLWADFSDPAFSATIKVWVAAADDSALYERLIPVEQRISRATFAAAERMATERGVEAMDRSMVELCITTMRGLAVSQLFEPRDSSPRVDRWPAHRDALLRLV